MVFNGVQVFCLILTGFVFGILVGLVIGRWTKDYETKYRDELFDD